MSCEAIEFAETEDRFEECLDLPISLSMVLHALRLECKKAVGSIIRPTHEWNIQVFYSHQCTCKVIVENFMDSVDYYIMKVVLVLELPVRLRYTCQTTVMVWFNL